MPATTELSWLLGGTKVRLPRWGEILVLAVTILLPETCKVFPTYFVNHKKQLWLSLYVVLVKERFDPVLRPY